MVTGILVYMDARRVNLYTNTFNNLQFFKHICIIFIYMPTALFVSVNPKNSKNKSIRQRTFVPALTAGTCLLLQRHYHFSQVLTCTRLIPLTFTVPPAIPLMQLVIPSTPSVNIPLLFGLNSIPGLNCYRS